MLINDFGVNIESHVHRLLSEIDFSTTLLNGVLSFMLFAGGLQVNIIELRKQRLVVGVLATVGVILSTWIIGIMTYYLCQAAGFAIPMIYCFLFGALISPTDPIAVLAILKRVAAPKSLEMKIAGESLFNDGVSIVMFLMLLGIVNGSQDHINMLEAFLEFIRQAFGGILVGLALGFILSYLIRPVSNGEVAILLTLSLVTGGYMLSDSLIQVSGPIVMVVAGLYLGNFMSQNIMPDNTIRQINGFWRIIDEIFNSILFVLIGLELLQIRLNLENIIYVLWVIPITLFSRLISVGLPIIILNRFKEFSPRLTLLLTWGGLRGGVCIALALALPASKERDVILTMTYAVVLFSILVQGLTFKGMVKRFIPALRLESKDIEDDLERYR